MLQTQCTQEDMLPPAMCYILFDTAINTLVENKTESRRFLLLLKPKCCCMSVPHQTVLFIRMNRESWYGNLEQHDHRSPMASGPQLPDKGLFQYPANMDDGGGVHAIRCSEHRGGCGLRTRAYNTQITGSSNRRRHGFQEQNTGSYIGSPPPLHHTTEMFSCSDVETLDSWLHKALLIKGAPCNIL